MFAALSSPCGLEDIAPGNPLRRTRPRGQQSIQTKAHSKNDPSTPQAWLPNRTERFSISHPSMIAISDFDMIFDPALIGCYPLLKCLSYTCAPNRDFDPIRLKSGFNAW